MLCDDHCIECTGPSLCIACKPDSGYNLDGGKCVKPTSLVVPALIFTIILAGIGGAVYFYKFRQGSGVNHEDYYYHKELDAPADDSFNSKGGDDSRL